MSPEEHPMSKEDVSKAIVAGMGFVHDLYREMKSLFRLIAEKVDSSDLEAGKPIARGPIIKLKSDHNEAYPFLRIDMGYIVELRSQSPDDEDEPEADDELIDDDEDVSPSSKKGITIAPDTQFLAIRAVLFDPRHAKSGGFKPVIIGSVLSSITRTSTGKRKKIGGAPPGAADDTFQIRRRFLGRLVKHLVPETEPGQTIEVKITGHTLSATTDGVVTRPIADFDSEAAVESFVDELIAIAESES